MRLSSLFWCCFLYLVFLSRGSAIVIVEYLKPPLLCILVFRFIFIVNDAIFKAVSTIGGLLYISL